MRIDVTTMRVVTGATVPVCLTCSILEECTSVQHAALVPHGHAKPLELAGIDGLVHFLAGHDVGLEERQGGKA